MRTCAIRTVRGEDFRDKVRVMRAMRSWQRRSEESERGFLRCVGGSFAKDNRAVGGGNDRDGPGGRQHLGDVAVAGRAGFAVVDDASAVFVMDGDDFEGVTGGGTLAEKEGDGLVLGGIE